MRAPVRDTPDLAQPSVEDVGDVSRKLQIAAEKMRTLQIKSDELKSETRKNSAALKKATAEYDALKTQLDSSVGRVARLKRIK